MNLFAKLHDFSLPDDTKEELLEFQTQQSLRKQEAPGAKTGAAEGDLKLQVEAADSQPAGAERLAIQQSKTKPMEPKAAPAKKKTK